MSATPASQQQFCVRWNSHLGSLGAAFPQLLAGQRFVDVTLACEGHQLHCHRLVLAACSSYFESLLSENPCKHPIIIMPHDIKLWEIQALVDFMYKGEVNVSQAGLPDLLRCAEVLQIRGLCGSDAALNLNSVTNAIQGKETIIPGSNAAANTSSTHPLIPTAAAATSLVPSTPPPPSSSSTSVTSTLPSTATVTGSNSVTSNNASAMGQQKLPMLAGQINAVTACANSPGNQTGQSISNANGGLTGNKRLLMTSHDNSGSGSGGTCHHALATNTSQYATSTPNNTVTPKLEPVDISMDGDMDEDSSTVLNDISKMDGEEPDYMEGSGKQSNEFPLANVICEYDGGLQISMDNVPGRRVRRSEAILRQAAECVSKGQTFQTVSDMFNIPISTIRFFMARKGILPRRKRGRAAGSLLGQSELNISSSDHSRPLSPSEPPFHFAHYKLPEIKPRLL